LRNISATRTALLTTVEGRTALVAMFVLTPFPICQGYKIFNARPFLLTICSPFEIFQTDRHPTLCVILTYPAKLLRLARGLFEKNLEE